MSYICLYCEYFLKIKEEILMCVYIEGDSKRKT